MRPSQDCTAEQLIEALENNYGIISSTIDYIHAKWKIKVTRHFINTRIERWGMQDFVQECRIYGVEKALSKRFANALDNGNENAIGWILAKYGHHMDFLEQKEEENNDVNKGDIIDFFKSLKKKDSADSID